MDKELDFTPEVNSSNFLNILAIIERLSFAGSLDSEYIQNILNTKSAQQLFALNYSLTYLSFKESLTRNIFDFLLETPHIILINKFLIWFKELTFNKPELLELFNKLAQVLDLEKVLNRLNQLNSENVITESEEYNVVFASIELIENNVDNLEYIGLLKHSEQPHILGNAIAFLKKENLLLSPYLKFISETYTIQYYPIIKAMILSKLNKANILTAENFELCIEHDNLLSLENIIQILSEKNYLEKYFIHVSRKRASSIQTYLNFLKNNNLLENLYLDLLVNLSGSKLDNFVEIILLSKNYLKNNTNTLLNISTMKKSYLGKLVDAINLIRFEGCLNEKGLHLLLSNRAPSTQIFEFSQSYIILYENGLYEKWIDKIFLNPKALLLSLCMVSLNKLNILSLENFNKINQVDLIQYYYRIIKNLNNLKIFNENNFENMILLSKNIDLEKFKKISLKKNVVEAFYSDIFNIILDNTINPLDKSKKTLELLDKDYSKARSSSINPVESTHLTSINRAFTDAIEKFKENYSNIFINLDLDQYYDEIEKEIDEEFKDYDSVKSLAAKRALKGIIRDSTFIDEQSQLTLEKHYALLWAGIQDESKRSGTLNDAKKQLLEGLYEIQRGGNLNSQGVDNNLPDEPICCSGAFHKLLEKLVGVHSFLHFVYITPELASLKLPIIIKEEANKYLLSIEPSYIFQNFDRFQEQGVPAIWKHIKFKVRERMLDEFGTLYKLSDSGEIHESFETLLDNYNYLDLDSDLLNSIKTSQIIKSFEFSLTSYENCGIGEGEDAYSRKKRNIHGCFEDEEKGKKFYQPILIRSNKIKKAIGFLSGILELKRNLFVIKKIAGLDYNKYSSEVNKLENLEFILQENLIATDIEDQVDMVELENTNGRKVYLNIKQTDALEKNNYNIYCSDINSEIFLKFDSDLNLEDIIKLYEQLLFPKETSFYVRAKFFKYTIPRDEIIEDIKPRLPTELNWIIPPYNSRSINNLLINEELWPFFLVHDEVITTANQINQIRLDGHQRPIKFIFEKITDIFSFETQQQINLGNILNSPYVKIEQIQDPNITPNNLDKFRIDLLMKIMDKSKNNVALNPLTLTEMTKNFFFSELSQYLTNEEIDLILNNNIKSHNFSVLNIHSIISYSRQLTVLIPALIQTMNGHTDNLEKLALIMGSDLTFNHAYQSLIKSPDFIKRFPKTVNVLAKINFAVTSPISKLLLLNSFYELASTLTKNKPFTPEYKLAKNLLVDNSIIFGTMLVESLGLNLGFGGLIIDLGVTIHQLITSIYYFREKEHLDITFWEGIKFELGFSNRITHLLEEREFVYNYTLFVNSLYEKFGIFYQYFLLKIPTYEETQSIFISRSKFPIDLLSSINKYKLHFVSTFGYRYSLKIPKSFYRTSSRDLFNFEKRQYILTKSNKFITVNFSHALDQFEENNIFVHKEKICSDYFLESCLYSPRPISNCYIRKRCEEKPHLIYNWKIVSSTKKLENDTGVYFQKKSNLIIENELSALLENTHAMSTSISNNNLLILFCPLFGNMSIIDGDFLRNISLDILVHNSPYDEFFIDDRSLLNSNFSFKNQRYVNKVHYLVASTNSLSSIYDNSQNLSIETIDLYQNFFSESIRMIDDTSLKFGKLGPIFNEVNLKKNIKIILNKNFYLKGEFNFLADSVYLENIRSFPGEEVIFYLLKNNSFFVRNIEGKFIFFNQKESLTIKFFIQKINYGIIIKDNNNCFQVITSINSDNLKIIPFSIHKLANFFFISGTNKNSFFYLKGSLGKPYQKLIFENTYSVNNEVFKVQFNFQNNQWTCLFFGLSVNKFLLSNIKQLKNFLDNNFFKYLVFKNDNTYDRVDYTDEGLIKYKNIFYTIDSTLGLLAIHGKVIETVNSAESFKNILPNVIIDLRQQGLLKKINSTSLRVGEREICDISLNQQLLTDQGNVYIGLLPISIDYVNARQINVLAINETKYKSNKFAINLESSNVNQPASMLTIGLGGGGLILIVVSFFLYYKHRYLHQRFHSPLMDLSVAYTLVKPTQASFDSKYSSGFLKKKYERIHYHSFTNNNIELTNNSIRCFFDNLPNNIIFAKYCYNFFIKMKKNFVRSFDKKILNANQILYSFGNEINKYIELNLPEVNYKFFNELLKLLIKICCLNFENNNTIFIKNISEFNLLIDFIKKINILKKILKNTNINELNAINLLVKKISKIYFFITNEVHENLDLPNENTILDLIKNLKLNENAPNNFSLYVHQRLNILNDGLSDFNKPNKKKFNELSYFLLNVFLEAKRLSFFINKNHLIKDEKLVVFFNQVLDTKKKTMTKFTGSHFFSSNNCPFYFSPKPKSNGTNIYFIEKSSCDVIRFNSC